MAFTTVVPVSLNPTITIGGAQKFTCPVVTSDGTTAVNLTGWTALVAKLIPPAPNPTGSDVSFGTVASGAAGLLTLETAAADLSGASPGTARFVILGKPTAPDDLQVLATGTATIQAG